VFFINLDRLFHRNPLTHPHKKPKAAMLLQRGTLIARGFRPRSRNPTIVAQAAGGQGRSQYENSKRRRGRPAW
jgi:hypothetical protein